MPRIALSMIVRDEIESLARCLDSVTDLVDEVVIVDTGSTDGTVALGKARADTFVEIEWPDHFGEARNVSLEHVSAEWVLVLDGDEVLATGHDDIQKTIRKKDVFAAELSIRNELAGGQCGDFWALRLFRKHPDVRWSGRIHEQVLPDIQSLIHREPSWRVERLNARIDHSGYRPEVMEKKSKSARNQRMLSKALDELSADAPLSKRVYLEYKLSGELGNDGAKYLCRAASRLLEAQETERHRIGLSAEVLISASQYWCSHGDPELALRAGLAAQSIHPRNAMVSLVCGQAAWGLGDINGAKAYASDSRNTATLKSPFHYDSVAHDVALSTLEIDIEGAFGRADRQREIVASLCTRHPGDAAIQALRLRVLMHMGEAKTVLTDGLKHMKAHGASVAVLLLCADAADALGMPDKAQTWREIASGAGPSA